MKLVLLLFLCLVLVPFVVYTASDIYGQNPQHEFGSVRGPRTSSIVPFWKLEGFAAANEEVIRVVEDRQSKRGGIWNTEPNNFANWELTYKLRIHGVSALGADGIAFWYVKDPSTGGEFFGHNDEFTGLGVILDTYDNDNTGLHPLLLAVTNDGTKKFRHEHPHDGEGTHLKNDMEIGNCQFQIRNRDHPSLVTVRYSKGQLSVLVSINEGDSPRECVAPVAVTIPTGYYFGFTAATGQLADNHDIYGVALKNLDEDANTVDSQRVYSHYDKYAISELLAKIQYDMAQMRYDSYNFQLGDAPEVRLGTDVWERLHRVEDIGTEVAASHDILKALEEKVASIAGRAPAKEGEANTNDNNNNNNAELREEVDNVKREVEGMHNTLRSLVNSVGTLEGLTKEMRDRGDQNRRDNNNGNRGEIFPNVYKNNNKGRNNESVIEVLFGDSIIGTLLTILFWIVVVIVVVVMLVAILVIWKNKRDRQRKYF